MTLEPICEISFRQIINFLTFNIHSWDTPSSRPADVSVIETHGATVLLGKVHALKLKKPVLFDHMDYSTLKNRKVFLDKEMQINRRTAPDLYVGVISLFRTNTGELTFNTTNTLAEHALKMKRFADKDRLDRYSELHGIDPLLGESLCAAIVAFHKLAPSLRDCADIPDFHRVIDQNFLQLEQFCLALFKLEDVQSFRADLHAHFSALASLEKQRCDQGWVRYGHGDLHLQNICLFEGKPLLFDAIEYEDDFVIGDILYDLSFLLMDLTDKGLPCAANRIFNQYFRQSGWLLAEQNLECLKLLPFFMAMRAGIRVHVAANRFTQATDTSAQETLKTQAVQLLAQAKGYLSACSRTPVAIAIGGYSGSGKSTVAGAVAPQIGMAPGALRIRSDEVRRQLIKWDDYAPMPQSAYTSDMSKSVYEQMIKIATTALNAGHSVVIDAVLDRGVDRQLFQKSIETCGVPFYGFWLQVDKSVMEARITGRTNDASDATIDVLHAQLARQPVIDTNWTKINANGSVLEITDELLNQIK